MPLAGDGDALAATEVETRPEGIAHNYEDADVLTDQGVGLPDRLRHPAWLAALLGPMALYLGPRCRPCRAPAVRCRQRR